MPGSPLSAPREMRFRWYLQSEKYGKTVAEVCTIFGISKKTYHKWYNRDHGYGSPHYRSRKLHPKTKMSPRVRMLIYNAKIRYNYGPEKMRLYLEREYGIVVSTTIIYRYFKRRKLIRKPQRKQPWYTPMKERFISTKPGENVQVDTKYVPAKDEPGTWNYQFRFTDTFTNMQYAIDCLDKSSAAAVHAFGQAERSFPFAVTGVQSDNGSEFRGEFARYLESRDITHRFIPKRSAPWNGKVERANRSVDDEYYLNPFKPWHTLNSYTKWYNEERPHLGKGMNGMTPREKYDEFMQKLPKELPLNVN